MKYFVLMLVLCTLSSVLNAQMPPPRPMPPPRGVLYSGEAIKTLPPGFTTIRFNSTPYYFVNGTFYTEVGNEFVITPAPLGLRVDRLPAGAIAVAGTRNKQFEYGGVRYKKFGRRWEVVASE
ncbi:MAG: DUF6515 family protein [Pseudomonadota bacterium]